MKINITIGSKETKNGYVNIDPITGSTEPEKNQSIKADIRNLDSIVDDSECTELIAEDALDFLESKEALTTLSHWIKKLRHGGKIVVGGIDAYETCRLFFQQKIDLQSFNALIHGDFSSPWDVRLSHLTMEELSNYFIKHDLQILKKGVEGFRMFVKGERQ